MIAQYSFAHMTCSVSLRLSLILLVDWTSRQVQRPRQLIFNFLGIGAAKQSGLRVQVWIGNKKGRTTGVTQRFLRRRLLQAPANFSQNSITQRIATAPSPIPWEAAVDHMSKVYIEQRARQAAADARVNAAKIKPRYEFYGKVSLIVDGSNYESVVEDLLNPDPHAMSLLCLQTLGCHVTSAVAR